MGRQRQCLSGAAPCRRCSRYCAETQSAGVSPATPAWKSTKMEPAAPYSKPVRGASSVRKFCRLCGVCNATSAVPTSSLRARQSVALHPGCLTYSGVRPPVAQPCGVASSDRALRAMKQVEIVGGVWFGAGSRSSYVLSTMPVRRSDLKRSHDHVVLDSLTIRSSVRFHLHPGTMVVGGR